MIYFVVCASRLYNYMLPVILVADLFHLEDDFYRDHFRLIKQAAAIYHSLKQKLINIVSKMHHFFFIFRD